jgi:DNA-directed DNA polymerase III PolC
MAKVKEVRQSPYKGKVHDLTVRERHAYNVEGMAVHNSAAGCLVSWCLGLTECDPIEHGLLFERFLDEGRPDPPDIDTDFHPAIRQRVKNRIVEMFGKEKTCSIGTYTTYKTRAVIIDVARALGYDVMEANMVTKGMDPLKSFENEDGESEVVDKMDFDELCRHYPELGDYLDKYPEVRVHAEVIRNQVRNMGKHAGGVIISDMDLSDRIPVQRDNSGGGIISSWAESGNTAELSEVGLVKYDILGLNNLPVIADCVSLVKKHRGKTIRRDEIPLDDHLAIKMESNGDLKGIFQFESPATKPIVDAVGMESLADVSAITSLLRPGPKDMGMHMEYAERKQGAHYDVIPCLRSVFKDTYGILVYQEQMMQISRILCGFDGPMSNKLRKACGKKIKDLMVSIRESFIQGAQTKIDNGEVTMEQVVDLWNLIVSFAKYGFNKSHAVTYSMISTAELWLKHNYFREYMCALFINTKANAKKHGSSNILVDYINYTRRRGVEVFGPDINSGEPDFYIDGRCIGYGMAHVRNVASAAKDIAKVSAKTPFKSMADFYQRCEYETAIKSGINKGKMKKSRPTKKVVESLIYAGAFDRFGGRNQVMDDYVVATLGVPNPTDEELADLQEKMWQEAEPADINGPDLDKVRGLRSVGGHIMAIAEDKPFTSIWDFHERCVYENEVKSGKNKGEVRTVRPTKKVVEALIYAGAFDRFDDRRKLLRDYYLLRGKIEPSNLSEEELEELEVEHIGLCLSKPPLCRRYQDMMNKEGWTAIGENASLRKPIVFGRVDKIDQRTSKTSGNPMYVVRISDGMDALDFFVFMGEMDFFRSNVKKGQLAAIPLDRFKDSNTRFFDVERPIKIVKETE